MKAMQVVTTTQTPCDAQASGAGAGLLAALFAVRLAEVQAKRRCWDACAAALSAAAARPAAHPAGCASAHALMACDADRVAGDAARWQGHLAAALGHYQAAERAAAAALADPIRRRGCGSAQAPGDGAKSARQAPRVLRGRGDRAAAEPGPADGGSVEPGGGGGRLAWALRGARARGALGRAKCAAAAGEPDLAAQLAAGALACLAPPSSGGSEGAAAAPGPGTESEPGDAALRDAPVAAAAVLLFQAALLQGGPAGARGDADCPITPASRGSTVQGSESGSEGDEMASSLCAGGAGEGSAARMQLWGCTPASGAQQPGSSSAAAAGTRASDRGAAKAPAAAGGRRRRAGAAQTINAAGGGDAAAAPVAQARLRLLLRALAAGGGVPLLAR